MARKKDLGGLAALAGLAYLASRDKGDKGVDLGTSNAGYDDTQATGSGGDFMSEKEPGWESGTASESSARPTAAAPRATPKPAAKPMGSSNPDYGNEGRRPVKEASSKTAYETPYDRMNRLNREAAQAKADADAETRKLRSAHPATGRGVIDTSRVNPNTLLPYKKGGAVKKMASGGSVKGWGIARGSRKAKTY